MPLDGCGSGIRHAVRAALPVADCDFHSRTCSWSKGCERGDREELKRCHGSSGGSANPDDGQQPGSEPNRGIVATALGLVGLIVSATGVLMQLQQCLNKAWKVKVVGSGLRHFAMQRVRSGLLLVG